MALGVIAFAVVGIMGLFPVAMDSALESQRETRAAHIARQIFSDLKSSPSTDTFIATSTDILSGVTRLSLSSNSTNGIGYDIQGQPVGGTNAPNAIYAAFISVMANTPTNGLARVQATVEVPAQAASSNRSKFTFVTLMRQ